MIAIKRNHGIVRHLGFLLLSIIQVILLASGRQIAASGSALDLGSQATLSGFSIGDVDHKCWETFLNNAPNAWASLKRQLREFEVDVVFNQKWVIETKLQNQLDEWTVCVPADPDCLLVFDKSSSVVSGANEKYSFRVDRSSLQRPYMLNKIQPRLTDGQSILFGSLLYSQEFMNYIDSIWWVPCDFIIEHLGVRDFKVVAARFTKDFEGRNVAQVAFQYVGELREQPHCEPGAIYWAELLSDMDWIVTRSGVSYVGEGDLKLRIRVTTSYQHWFGGSSFPKEIELAYENLDTHRIVEIRNVFFNPPSPLGHREEEFYLPYYGISEAVIESFQKTDVTWRVIINILAIVILVIAILINRQVRRTSKEREN